MKKKLCIVSSDDIILYQPCILNLYHFLQEKFDVTIISFEPEYLGKKKDEEKQILYIKDAGILKKVLRTAELVINAPLKRIDRYLFRIRFRALFTRKLKEKLLKTRLTHFDADVFIAVDPMPLFAVQQVKGKTHFLSLEIIPGDPYLKKIDTGKILSVIIQNEMRYRYLFDKTTLKTFYIQNAPLLQHEYKTQVPRQDLVWGGTIVKDFAVLDCFKFLSAYPQYKMVFKGATQKKTKAIIESEFSSLLASDRAVINSSYMEAAAFIEYLSKFRIGFCFYNWEIIRKNINYRTAPSGKLFMYLAAGVPVIASKIPGFTFIEEYGAGVLVEDYSPQTIHDAIQIIEADFERYSKNAYRAFEENCFDKNGYAFRDFLNQDIEK